MPPKVTTILTFSTCFVIPASATYFNVVQQSFHSSLSSLFPIHNISLFQIFPIPFNFTIAVTHPQQMI